MEPQEWVCPPIQTPDVVTYKASFIPNESDSRVTIRFESVGKSLDELQTVVITEVGFEGASSRELELTGAVSEWVLNVSPATETMTVSVPIQEVSGRPGSLSGTSLIILEEKPLTYWVAQYDLFEDSATKRAEAMVGLRAYVDNPDIELALRDRLEQESDMDVLAEGLATMAAVTGGAKGTEGIFLEYLAPDRPVNIQRVATRALSAYSENQEVLRRLRVLVQRSEDPQLRNDALRSMSDITDAPLFKNSTERFLTDDRLIDAVPQILAYRSDKGETEQALEIASTFLSAVVPFDVRIQLLQWMLKEADDPEFWEPKLPSLLSDRDPRIRALSVWAFVYVSSEKADEWSAMVKEEEFDKRVLYQLEKMRQQSGLEENDVQGSGD